MSDHDYEPPFNPMQAIVDGIGKDHEKRRAKTQMTLGKLINLLDTIEPARLISGLGELDSYRGYYSDLAFIPDAEAAPAADVLGRCRAAMGRTFQGYKGGDFQMHENTPLWISPYGDASGIKVMDLDQGQDPIVPLTEQEVW